MSQYTGFEGFSFREYDLTEKDRAVNRYCLDMMNRVSSMFEYEGDYPDTFKPEFMDVYLFVYGHCAVFRDDAGDLRVSFGSWGGFPDPYYIPRDYIIANPYLPGGTKAGRTYHNNEDCIVIKNDMHAVGLRDIFEKHATMLVENDISRLLAEYNSRVSDLLAAEDDKTKKSAELFLKRIEEGKLGVIASNAMLDSFKAYRQTAGANTTLLPLIEHHQYIKSEWLSDLGLDSNWNGKREAVNSAETALNKDYLMPLVDQMLLQRQDGLDKVNKMFGTDIRVKLASSWRSNEQEEEAELDILENEAEGGAENDTGTEEAAGNVQSDGRNIPETEE